MRPLSVVDQDAAIRQLFPAFKQICQFDFLGMWRGPLRQLARTYEVGIAYYPRVSFAGAIIINPWIFVTVLDPEIGLDPRGTGEKPPHIYVDARMAPGWSLCLYHPKRGDWEPDQLIATTIIRWAAEWLFFYEGWLFDGHWAGGGEHPIPRDSTCPTIKPSFPDLPAASLRAAFLKAGRLTGTFVSSLSMAVVSAESFPQPFLPAWKPPAAPSSIISIS